MVQKVLQNTSPQPLPPPPSSSNNIISSTFKDKIIDIFNSNRRIILMVVCVICLGIIIYIPHYNINGKYVFFGTFYTKNEANYVNKYNKINSDYVDVESKLASSKTNENLFLNKLENTLQKNEKLNNEVEELNSRIDLLKSKFNQQEQFIQNQVKEEKNQKVKKAKVKKTQFADVSKKIVNNDRPQFGNMFANNIKKHVSD
jgi:hypothetical protein